MAPPLPQNSGGNDPQRAAALQQKRAMGNNPGVPTDPAQMPQGASGTGPAQSVGDYLAEAFRLMMANGPNAEDIAAVEQFFMSLQQMQQQPGGPQQPSAQPPQQGPPMPAGPTASGAPQLPVG